MSFNENENNNSLRNKLRNAERQRLTECRKLERLRRDTEADLDEIEEKEVLVRELTGLIDNKGGVADCSNCDSCKAKEDCDCQCGHCDEVGQAGASRVVDREDG